MKKGEPKVPGAGRNFTGPDDPRINRDIPGPGRPPDPDARILQIQANMRSQLAETMYELWKDGYAEVERKINEGNLSLGEMIAARFLHVTAKSGSYPHFQTILKTIGLNPPENINVSVTHTLESVILSAHKKMEIENNGQQKQQLETYVQPVSVQESASYEREEVQRGFSGSNSDEEDGERS